MALCGKGVPGRGAAGAKALRWDGAWHAQNRAGRPAEQRGRRGQRSERRQGRACVLAATGRSACLLVLSGVPWRPSSKDTWSDVGFRTQERRRPSITGPFQGRPEQIASVRQAPSSLKRGSAEPCCPGEKASLSQSKANTETEFDVDFLLSADLWNP